MRLCADENFPGDAVAELRGRGHDVLWIHDTQPGATDVEVLTIAQQDERLLVTFDKDFGELAFRTKLPATRGIVLFRLSGLAPREMIRMIVNTLESREDWQGSFAVIRPQRIRVVPLPNR